MSLVETIAKQAQATFSKSLADENFTENLSKLIRNVAQIRFSDLKLSKDTTRTSVTGNSSTPSPPATYVEILENESFSMGIFLMRSGSTIPLHDHPGMHGVLKVIKGTIKITSYSAVSNVPVDMKLPQDIINRIKKSQRDLLIPVEKHSSGNVTLKDEPFLLRPREGNFHEISAVGGQAAFLDLLAPPYDLDERDCHYYTTLETNKPDSEIKTWLLRTAAPAEFWYDTAPYTGPTVNL